MVSCALTRSDCYLTILTLVYWIKMDPINDHDWQLGKVHCWYEMSNFFVVYLGHKWGNSRRAAHVGGCNPAGYTRYGHTQHDQTETEKLWSNWTSYIVSMKLELSHLMLLLGLGRYSQQPIWYVFDMDIADTIYMYMT